MFEGPFFAVGKVSAFALLGSVAFAPPPHMVHMEISARIHRAHELILMLTRRFASPHLDLQHSLRGVKRFLSLCVLPPGSDNLQLSGISTNLAR